MLPKGAKFGFELLVDSSLLYGFSEGGIIGLFGVGEKFCFGYLKKEELKSFVFGISFFSDICFWKSDLLHTTSKEKVGVAYNQVTQNRRS